MKMFLLNLNAYSRYTYENGIWAITKNEAIAEASPDPESFLEFISINPLLNLEKHSATWQVVSIRSTRSNCNKSYFDIESEITSGSRCSIKIKADSETDAIQKVRFLFGQAIALVPKNKKLLDFDPNYLNVVYTVDGIERKVLDNSPDFSRIQIFLDDPNLEHINRNDLISEIKKRQILITHVYNLNPIEAFYIFNKPYDNIGDTLNNRIAEVLSYR